MVCKEKETIAEKCLKRQILLILTIWTHLMEILQETGKGIDFLRLGLARREQSIWSLELDCADVVVDLAVLDSGGIGLVCHDWVAHAVGLGGRTGQKYMIDLLFLLAEGDYVAGQRERDHNSSLLFEHLL